MGQGWNSPKLPRPRRPWDADPRLTNCEYDQTRWATENARPSLGRAAARGEPRLQACTGEAAAGRLEDAERGFKLRPGVWRTGCWKASCAAASRRALAAATLERCRAWRRPPWMPVPAYFITTVQGLKEERHLRRVGENTWHVGSLPARASQEHARVEYRPLVLGGMK